MWGLKTGIGKSTYVYEITAKVKQNPGVESKIVFSRRISNGV